MGTFPIAVVPDQRLVVAITSANDQTLAFGFQLLFPLVRDVVMPALEGS